MAISSDMIPALHTLLVVGRLSPSAKSVHRKEYGKGKEGIGDAI